MLAIGKGDTSSYAIDINVSMKCQIALCSRPTPQYNNMPSGKNQRGKRVSFLCDFDSLGTLINCDFFPNINKIIQDHGAESNCTQTTLFQFIATASSSLT